MREGHKHFSEIHWKHTPEGRFKNSVFKKLCPPWDTDKDIDEDRDRDIDRDRDRDDKNSKLLNPRRGISN